MLGPTMTNAGDAEAPVVILGAGPGGLTAAYELSKHGVSSLDWSGLHGLADSRVLLSTRVSALISGASVLHKDPNCGADLARSSGSGSFSQETTLAHILQIEVLPIPNRSARCASQARPRRSYSVLCEPAEIPLTSEKT